MSFSIVTASTTIRSVGTGKGTELGLGSWELLNDPFLKHKQTLKQALLQVVN